MDALKRNSCLSVSYFESKDTFDFSTIDNTFDAILLPSDAQSGDKWLPDNVDNLSNRTTPIIARSSDPWNVSRDLQLYNKKKYKINAYFSFFHEDFFHKYYPKDFFYKRVMIGLESNLYHDLQTFETRRKNKILLSGAIGNRKITSRLYGMVFRQNRDPNKFYNLRTKCVNLPYVDYTSTLNHAYVGDRYPELLQKYQASIAATSHTYTTKYFEIPAAGCISFMEVNGHNYADTLGYKDGETAVFINEKNYRQKFAEYINDPENSKWTKIADAGKKFTVNNFTHDHATESLVGLIKQLIN